MAAFPQHLMPMGFSSSKFDERDYQRTINTGGFPEFRPIHLVEFHE